MSGCSNDSGENLKNRGPWSVGSEDTLIAGSVQHSPIQNKTKSTYLLVNYRDYHSETPEISGETRDQETKWRSVLTYDAARLRSMDSGKCIARAPKITSEIKSNQTTRSSKRNERERRVSTTHQSGKTLTRRISV